MVNERDQGDDGAEAGRVVVRGFGFDVFSVFVIIRRDRYVRSEVPFGSKPNSRTSIVVRYAVSCANIVARRPPGNPLDGVEFAGRLHDPGFD